MRRTLFALLILVGCGSTQQPQIVTDARLIETGVRAFTPLILTFVRASPDDTAMVNRYSADAINAAEAIIATVGKDGSAASKLATAVQSLGPIAIRYLPVGGREAIIAQATLDLLPAMLAGAGIVGAKPAGRNAMTPEAARAVLATVK
jgi:hypothetical protein